MTLELESAVVSARGAERAVEQDAHRAGERLLAVADGFGPDGGRVAARAVAALDAGGVPRDGDPAAVLTAGVERARAVTDGGPASGTTLTAVLLAGETLAVAHVGDTRAYLLRDGRLTRLTADHSKTAALVAAGQLTPDQVVEHPERAVLLRALGRGEPVADFGAREVRAGDRCLLCSDGLWTVVPDTVIARTLTTAGSPGGAARELLAAALAAGAPDDVSCVVAEVVRRV